MAREQQPRRRLALTLALLALLVTAGGAVVVVNRRGEQVATTPPASARRATPFSSVAPPRAARTTTPPPSAPPSTTPPTRTPSPTPKLSFDDAVSRLRGAVEDGAAGGEMRGDVATDLLNLIRPLQTADGKDVDAQLATLRHKIIQRTVEGNLTEARAAILKARLTDVDRAAGM
jgi:serine/threonine-protein kinase